MRGEPMTDPDAIESRKRQVRDRLVCEAVCLGWLAAVEGLPVDCCPYDGDMAGYWIDGYRMVSREPKTLG